MFQSLLTKVKKSGARIGPHSSSTPSGDRSRTRIPSRHQRWPGFNPKLRIYTAEGAVALQPAFCLPSCPIEDEDQDPHPTGLYLHKGKSPRTLSFLLGANNPPPEIKAAHDKLMAGSASEEDEELLLSFLAHHPFHAGNVTDNVWWSADEPVARLVMRGNPLSFVEPEVEALGFEPIRVAPIKPAG
ncbi:MAG: hypothetical protein Q9219_007299 [cf. Caloplaca sp. 3 TL-2023]